MESYTELRNFYNGQWQRVLRINIAIQTYDCLETYDIGFSSEEYENLCASVMSRYMKYNGDIDYSMWTFAKAYCEEMANDKDYAIRVFTHKETEEDDNDYWWRLGQ